MNREEFNMNKKLLKDISDRKKKVKGLSLDDSGSVNPAAMTSYGKGMTTMSINGRGLGRLASAGGAGGPGSFLGRSGMSGDDLLSVVGEKIGGGRL
jgi:hypothetical protein